MENLRGYQREHFNQLSDEKKEQLSQQLNQQIVEFQNGSLKDYEKKRMEEIVNKFLENNYDQLLLQTLKECFKNFNEFLKSEEFKTEFNRLYSRYIRKRKVSRRMKRKLMILKNGLVQTDISPRRSKRLIQKKINDLVDQIPSTNYGSYTKDEFLKRLIDYGFVVDIKLPTGLWLQLTHYNEHAIQFKDELNRQRYLIKCDKCGDTIEEIVMEYKGLQARLISRHNSHRRDVPSIIYGTPYIYTCSS